LAPDCLAFQEIAHSRSFRCTNRDLDDDYPPAGRALKDAIAAVDAVLFVTPEYKPRALPGRPEETPSTGPAGPHGNKLIRGNKPSAVIGGPRRAKIGTAVGHNRVCAVALGFL